MKQKQFQYQGWVIIPPPPPSMVLFSPGREGRDDFLNLDPPSSGRFGGWLCNRWATVSTQVFLDIPLPYLCLQSQVITAVIALLYNLLFPLSPSVVCRKRNSTHAAYSRCAPEPEGLRRWHEGSASHCSWGKQVQSEKLPAQCSGILMRTRRRA